MRHFTVKGNIDLAWIFLWERNRKGLDGLCACLGHYRKKETGGLLKIQNN